MRGKVRSLLVAGLLAATGAMAPLAAAPRIAVRLGHSDRVTSVAISPDGRIAASASFDKTIKIWDLSSGRELRSLVGHSGWVESIAFSPDGKTLLSGAGLGDDGMRLWDVATGAMIKAFAGHRDSVNEVAFSPDGRTLLSASRDTTLKLWNLSSGSELRSFAGHADMVLCAAFSPDGRRILSGSLDKTMRLWDAASGRELMSFAGHEKGINAVAFSPDGRTALSASSDKTIRLWELSSGKEICALAAASGVYAAAFSPDGKTLLSGSDEIELWDLASRKRVRTFPGHAATVLSLAFAPGGATALSGSIDKTLKLWDIDSGKELLSFEGKAEKASQYSTLAVKVAFSPDGGALVSGSGKSLKVWDPATGKLLRVGDAQSTSYGIKCIAISPDGKRALTGADRAVRLWDLATGKMLLSLSGHADKVNSVAFSPDGTRAYSASDDKTLRAWSLDTGEALMTIADAPAAFEISPDGKRAIGFNDGGRYPLKLFDLEKGELVATSTSTGSYVGRAAFSPDGRAFASGQYDARGYKLKLWDAGTGAERGTFEGKLESLVGQVGAIAFSPDGKTLAACTIDNTIDLWDIASGTMRRRLVGHLDAAGSVAFSPDGRLLASGSSDGTIRIWDPATGEQLVAAMTTAAGEWLAWTPEGYFGGTPWAMKNLVYVVDGLSSYGIDQFFDGYYRPDLIAARLSGGASAKAASAPLPDLTKGIAAPPLVAIEVERAEGGFRGLAVLPAQAAYKIVDGTVKVRVVAKDQGGGIGGLRLFHNGKVAGEDLRGLAGASPQRAPSELTLAISLADGSNRLRAVGFSRDKTESSPAELVVSYAAPRAAKPALWVLAVGINQYRNAKYNLNYAVGDVDGFLASLEPPARKLFSDVKVIRVVDRAAVKAGVGEAFRQVAEQARPEDVFLFFYAGHGIALDGAKPGENDFYFVLSDLVQMTSPDQVAKAGISGAEFRGLVSSIKAQKQLQVIDACNSGALSASFAKRGAAEEIALARLSRSTGSVLIAASQGDQFAQEFAALGHGALTQALIEGLSGKAASGDGQITATRLKTWVEESMPDLTRRYSGAEQYPTGFAFGQDFPIGIK